MDKIGSIIQGTEGISDIRKEYLNKALELRYSQILASALNRLDITT
jgi:hypothetical protein